MKLNTFLHFSMNKFSFVELYAKCVKEGHIEWTRPEKAIETTKNAWQKAKLRLVMLSAGAIIEITCSKVKYYVIFFTSDCMQNVHLFKTIPHTFQKF